MAPRVSSRLAAKVISSPISDKENSLDDLSSAPNSPAPPAAKLASRQHVKPNASRSTKKGERQSVSAPTQPKSTGKSKTANKKSSIKTDVEDEDDVPPLAKGIKPKRASPTPKKDADDSDLPHNMGKRASGNARIKKEGGEEAKSTSRKRINPPSVKKQEQEEDAKDIVEDTEGPPKKKARKKAAPYGLIPGETPFPDWPHPTADECQTVHDLLMGTIEPSRRKRFLPPDDIPAPSEVVAGCGEVPSILDALIRTLLSAATNGKNSSNAFQGLIQRFGKAKIGLGKGSVDWNAVHEAPVEEVFEAIKSGGLAKNKSKNIKKILEVVHTENKQRLSALLKAEEAGEIDQMEEPLKSEKELELRYLKQGALTLDYYHVLEKDDAITTFTALPGIGVKTAACVNLFCMQRPCFAVDTHVFRLCQYLGWVPPDNTRGEKQKKADRNTTFSHCEVMIPDELKYGLHALFIDHGKRCPRCRAITGEKSEGWADANCVIEHLVRRTGAKKGGLDSPKKKAKGSKVQDSEDEGSDDLDLEDDQPLEKSASSRKKIANTFTPKKTKMALKAARSAKAAKGSKAAPRGKSVKAKRSTAKAMDSAEEDEEGDEITLDLTDEAEPSAEDVQDED